MKLLLIMRLFLFLLLAFVTSVTANVYPQSTRLSVDLQDATISQLINDIENQSEFIFIYYDGAVDLGKHITVKVTEQTVDKILDIVFDSTDNTYVIFDRQIVIGKKESLPPLETIKKPIIEVLEQLKKELHGKVTDSSGQPLPGVTVVIKGTTQGTITDADGNYSLTNISDDVTLVFSFVGMKTQEISVDGKTSLNVTLDAETIGIEEVVTVAYGTQKKITITGAVAAIKGDELVKSPVPNLTNALTGRVTGITTIQSSGQPGDDDATLRIRGIGTLSKDAAAPLILVDGIERSFSQLDPNEIESISVLKDASSTAVYGIRGANGVIIVTTKKGQEGKTQISYSGNYSIQTPTRLPKFLDGYTFAKLYNEALINDNPLTKLTFTDDELQKFKDQSDPLFYPDTDWLDLIMKDYAAMNQHNLSINGGTKLAKYFVSLGYLNQDGLYNEFQSTSGISNNNTYKRYNIRSNINIDVTKTTKIDFQLGGIYSQTNSSKGAEHYNVNISGSTPLYRGILDSAPTATIGYYDGKIITLDRSGNRNMIQTTLANGFVNFMDNSLNVTVGVKQNLSWLLKGLSARAKVAYDNKYTRTRIFNRNVETYTPVRVHNEEGEEVVVLRQNGEGADIISAPSTRFSRNRQFYMDWALEYANSFENHNVGALLLYNQKKKWYHSSSYPGIPLGYQDWVGRITYNYALKYILEFNLGRNGSENFPKHNRFGWFPALSAGWILTEEPWVKENVNAGTLSYLKLRASYGEVGNDRLGSERFMYFPSEYEEGSYGYLGEDPVEYISFIEGKTGNPDVTWERAKKLDIALDLKMFKDQFSLSFDYFYEKRDNILASLNTVPYYVAVLLQDAYNIGIVKNRGVEFETEWSSKINKFNYWINGNFSFARNKIEYMDEARNLAYPNLNRTGLRVGENFGYVFDGFFNTEEEILTAPLYFGKLPSLGDTKYKDITGDGYIDSNDQQAIKHPSFPEISYGFTFGWEYKNFDFSMLFQGATNYAVMVSGRVYKPFAAFGSSMELVEGRWHADSPDGNANATFPKLSVSYSDLQNYYNSTLNIKDASFLRVKNMELGYTLKKTKLEQFKISSCRFYLSGQNLYTWDKLKIIDPEGNPNANLKYPQLKVFNIGCRVQF